MGLENITWPESIRLCGDGTMVETLALARAVADDDHPGDDAVGPRHLFNTTREIVNLRRLRRLGVKELTPEIALQVVDAYHDDIMCLGSMAWSDAFEGKKGACSCRAPLCAGHAALVLVVASLLIERAPS